MIPEERGNFKMSLVSMLCVEEVNEAVGWAEEYSLRQ